jgi:hypothetical protein
MLVRHAGQALALPVDLAEQRHGGLAEGVVLIGLGPRVALVQGIDLVLEGRFLGVLKQQVHLGGQAGGVARVEGRLVTRGLGLGTLGRHLLQQVQRGLALPLARLGDGGRDVIGLDPLAVQQEHVAQHGLHGGACLRQRLFVVPQQVGDGVAHPHAGLGQHDAAVRVASVGLLAGRLLGVGLERAHFRGDDGRGQGRHGLGQLPEGQVEGLLVFEQLLADGIDMRLQAVEQRGRGPGQPCLGLVLDVERQIVHGLDEPGHRGRCGRGLRDFDRALAQRQELVLQPLDGLGLFVFEVAVAVVEQALRLVVAVGLELGDDGLAARLQLATQRQVLPGGHQAGIAQAGVQKHGPVAVAGALGWRRRGGGLGLLALDAEQQFADEGTWIGHGDTPGTSGRTYRTWSRGHRPPTPGDRIRRSRPCATGPAP